MKYLYLLYILILFTSCSKQGHHPKEIYLTFRYDDTSMYTTTDVETKILNIFKDHNVSLTFAVIPYRCAGNPIDIKPQKQLPLTLKKANTLKPFVDDGTLEIALHGYSHQTRSTKKWSEFEGVAYQEQFNKLSKGKKLLETLFDTNITSFVPPYNTYDANTIHALEMLDFKVLSANEEALQIQDNYLNYLSHTTTLDKIDDTLKKLQSSDNPYRTLTVMFHEYNFSKVPIKGVHKAETTFKNFTSLIERLKKQKNIHIVSLNQANQYTHSLYSK